jgi:hypothetical protein
VRSRHTAYALAPELSRYSLASFEGVKFNMLYISKYILAKMYALAVQQLDSR